LNNTLIPIYIFIFCILSISILSEPIRLPFPNYEQYEDENSIPKETIYPKDIIQPSKTEVNLPNIDNTSTKDSKTKAKPKSGVLIDDPYKGSYPRGTYYLNKKDTNNAMKEFNATSSEGSSNTALAKIEVVRMLANERKTNQAKSIVESIEDQDLKYKAMYELGIGLENSSKTKSDKEESIPLYLQIITEAPRFQILEKGKTDEEPPPNPLLARTRFTLAYLLFQLGEEVAAIDHLSRIILDFPKSEYIDDAYYLTGRIYEEGNSKTIRDLEKAKKYYKIFLKKRDKEHFKNSIYLKEIESRIKNL
jgi:outer membrane protein assembly factor BamD (BamD/ComL family)